MKKNYIKILNLNQIEFKIRIKKSLIFKFTIIKKKSFIQFRYRWSSLLWSRPRAQQQINVTLNFTKKFMIRGRTIVRYLFFFQFFSFNFLFIFLLNSTFRCGIETSRYFRPLPLPLSSSSCSSCFSFLHPNYFYFISFHFHFSIRLNSCPPFIPTSL